MGRTSSRKSRTSRKVPTRTASQMPTRAAHTNRRYTNKDQHSGMQLKVVWD